MIFMTSQYRSSVMSKSTDTKGGVRVEGKTGSRESGEGRIGLNSEKLARGRVDGYQGIGRLGGGGKKTIQQGG